MNDEYFMMFALIEAEKAFMEDEVPIGAVVVHNGKVIGKGYNKRTKNKSAISHAEIMAIDDACKYIGDWRLEDCTIYTTVEPCIMCSGAIIQSRMKRLVYGTSNSKFGAVDSITNIFEIKNLNHKVEVSKNVLEDECSSIMKSFFKKIRKKVDT